MKTDKDHLIGKVTQPKMLKKITVKVLQVGKSNAYIMDKLWFSQQCSTHSSGDREGLRATHVDIHCSNVFTPAKTRQLEKSTDWKHTFQFHPYYPIQYNMGFNKPQCIISLWFSLWLFYQEKECPQQTYTIWAALRALTASEVPIWNTTRLLSSEHVLKTTLPVPFSTRSTVPKESMREKENWSAYSLRHWAINQFSERSKFPHRKWILWN